MKYFLFRNYTVEPFFNGLDVAFSGYEDVSAIQEDADGYIWFYLMPYKTSPSTVVKEIAHYEELLAWVVSRLQASKPFLVFSMELVYQIHYETTDHSVEEAIHQYNQKIQELAKKNSSIKIISLSSFYAHYSENEWIDWKFFFLSQVPINPKLGNPFSKWFQRQLEIVEYKRKKCIVLDLDQTLWGGILGEDGIAGIQIGGDYPGNTFLFFQEYLLQLNQKGILLAICSKNNETDVCEVWERHPNLILRKEHFAAYRINWDNKAENIQQIAQELNIGLDSLIFVDDQPAERELVKQMLPQVVVPDFPQAPYLIPEFVKQLTENYFSTYQLTEEDRSKTQQYFDNAQREKLQHQFIDFDNYLRSLEIELAIEPLNEFNRVRFAQMTQKTNQFNLTTHRYTETDIDQLMNRGAQAYGLRVKDRFGDQGLSGLCIVLIQENQAEIDTFLLSCRILGKKIETSFMQYILMDLQKKGIQEIKANYIRSDKNDQVADFYDLLEFNPVDTDERSKKYIFDLNQFNYQPSDLHKFASI